MGEGCREVMHEARQTQKIVRIGALLGVSFGLRKYAGPRMENPLLATKVLQCHFRPYSRSNNFSVAHVFLNIVLIIAIAFGTLL